MQATPGRDASGRGDWALPTTLALRETVRRGPPTLWSQASKNKLYDRMFPDQGGSHRDDTDTFA